TTPSNSDHGGASAQGNECVCELQLSTLLTWDPGNGQVSNATRAEDAPCRNPSGHQEPENVDPMEEGERVFHARMYTRMSALTRWTIGQDSVLTRYERDFKEDVQRLQGRVTTRENVGDW
ncbi:12473_t:CDS:2, partial [Acaulospora colombiana]